MLNHSIIPVISLWEEFIQRHKEGTVEDFARWIIKEKKNEKPNKDSPPQKKPKSGGKYSVNLNESAKALLLINRLHRLIQIKTKPIIKKAGFTKDHEYGMLTQIFLLNNPNKKELAKEMLLENSTAVEISNRLVKRGLIKEADDPNDKRSTRLSLTDKGMKKLEESYISMKNVHATFLDCLDESESKELVRMLEIIEQYEAAMTTRP